MSNSVFLECNKVENVVTHAVWHEIRGWDDYSSGDISMDEGDIPTTDLDLLQHCMDHLIEMPCGLADALDGALEFELGITINGTFHEWDEIKHILGKK